MRKVRLKGYRVTKTSSGKTVVEQIPHYGLSASARIAARKKVKVGRRTAE